MRLFEKTHVYKHDWETVTSAHWMKYPNERLPHVDCVHVVNRDINQEEETMRIRRLLMVNFHMPAWIRKAAGISGAGIGIEEAFCDAKQKKLTLVQQNYTFSSLFTTSEVCTYEPHPENPEWTLFKQRAEYRVYGLGKLGGPIESAACGGAEGKSKEGASVMEEIIQRVKTQMADGIHCIEGKIQRIEDSVDAAVKVAEKSLHEAERALHEAKEHAERTALKAAEVAHENMEKLLDYNPKFAQAQSPAMAFAPQGVQQQQGKTGWRSWVSLTSWKKSFGLGPQQGGQQ